MGTGKDPRMREALRLARAGKREQARKLLIEVLTYNRDNADAWIVMAQVAESRREAIASMKQALRLRPDDEGAQRYLEFLLQGEKTATGPLSLSPWLWGGLGAIFVVCLAVLLILFLSQFASQTQTGESGAISDAQPVADQTTDCAALIRDALEVSDQGCSQVGRDEVCYGHDTVEAELVPGTNPPFDQPGNTIPVSILERFIASPLDLEKGDWGVGVFRLEANLPGTLPGQLVTLLVFGNTSLHNSSGDMQAFYFTSGLGGIRCDAVPFDGILVNMANGAGIAFKANGADITLQGSSILRSTANDSLAFTILSGTGTVSAFGQKQSLGAWQTVTVPMSGLDASGPPGPPQAADSQTVGAGCTLTGQGCPSGDQVAEAAPTNASVPIDPSIPTNTPVPVAPGQPTNTPVPLATNTPMAVSTAASTVVGSVAAATREPGVTGEPQPTAASAKTPTSSSAPTVTAPPPTTPPPTTPPPTTPPPTAPPPTTAPTVDVCPTITANWVEVKNKIVTLAVTSGAATTLETIQITWPQGNSYLQHINGQQVNAPPTNTTVTLSMPVGGSTTLTIKFEENAADTGYTIILTFSEGCEKQIVH